MPAGPEEAALELRVAVEVPAVTMPMLGSAGPAAAAAADTSLAAAATHCAGPAVAGST